MTGLARITLAAAAAFLATGLAAQDSGDRGLSRDPGGMLKTLPRGNYSCALPGDAGGDAFVVVAEEAFRISTASRYQSAAGDGTYLLRGRELLFTRGPRKGERFHRVGDNQLRKLREDGSESDLLCTRGG
ncbi:elongation factor P [Erythrobacter sp.]|uniref:elongation factor P n=1 Tax=Erythrobacter sp. TaxID=1042 RepID=UPI003C7491F6